MGRPRTWTDDELIRAVAASRSLRAVFLELGLSVGGASWVAMQDHILRLGLDTSHWRRDLRAGGSVREPLPDWTKDQLLQAYADARSVADVMRRLGLDPNRKRGRRAVEAGLRELGLDPRSLGGRAWADGRVVPVAQRRARPFDEILVRGSTYTSTSHLKRRLLDAGLKEPRCEGCGLTAWRGQAVPLHLDHVDGDRRNNLLDNLRILCPNCHALTDTYCGRNIGAGYSR
jgi:hypothetical protein